MARTPNRKRLNSPRKQTTLTSFAQGSGRGGGQQPPTASAERAAARRRQALNHLSTTDHEPPTSDGNANQTREDQVSGDLSPPNRKLAKKSEKLSLNPNKNSRASGLSRDDDHFKSPQHKHTAKTGNSKAPSLRLNLRHRIGMKGVGRRRTGIRFRRTFHL
jgi:hypothetical protein